MRDTLHATIDGISLEGFSEPVSVAILRETHCSRVSQHPGIYVVLRMWDCQPNFLVKSTAGAFKKKDPTCPAEFVSENWIDGANVVYIGKAALFSSPKTGLAASAKPSLCHVRPPKSTDCSKAATPIIGIGKNVRQSCLGTHRAYSKSLRPEVHSMELVGPGFVRIIRLSAALADQLQLLCAGRLEF
jgi:hypothetical protein